MAIRFDLFNYLCTNKSVSQEKWRLENLHKINCTELRKYVLLSLIFRVKQFLMLYLVNQCYNYNYEIHKIVKPCTSFTHVSGLWPNVWDNRSFSSNNTHSFFTFLVVKGKEKVWGSKQYVVIGVCVRFITELTWFFFFEIHYILALLLHLLYSWVQYKMRNI